MSETRQRRILRRRVDIAQQELEPGEYLAAKPGEPRHAIVCCPACKRLASIARHLHVVDVMGDVDPLFECPYAGCASCESLHLEEWVPEAKASA